MAKCQHATNLFSDYGNLCKSWWSLDLSKNCKGICLVMKADSTPNRLRYRLGQKRCTFCGVFFDIQDIRCPCCKAVLRTKPRGKKVD